MYTGEKDLLRTVGKIGSLVKNLAQMTKSLFLTFRRLMSTIVEVPHR